jgi:hypothetical protein
MLATRRCGHGNREGRVGVSLVGWQGSEGRIPPPSLDPRVRTKWRGEVTSLPLSPSRLTLPPFSDIDGRQVGIICDRTTSEMRGLSPKIISGDSR